MKAREINSSGIHMKVFIRKLKFASQEKGKLYKNYINLFSDIRVFLIYTVTSNLGILGANISLLKYFNERQF
jgi:hypothetical protein